MCLELCAKKLPEKQVGQQQERSTDRCAVPEENNGFAGDTSLATLLSVIGPLRGVFWLGLQQQISQIQITEKWTAVRNVLKVGVSSILLKNRIWTYTKYILLINYFWASMCSGNCVQRHTALCLDFNVLVSLGHLLEGRGCVSPS